LNFSDSVENVMQALTQIAALGASGAEYVALRALGEPDAFPSTDLTLRREAQGGDSALTSRGLEARAEVWRPWRGYAAFHLWAAATGAEP
jgi:3-methyladenine DNA glycosylase/8-oxoguanine DNA glycosylase